MYRIIPKRYLFLFFAWVVLGLLYLATEAHEILGTSLKWSSIPALGWIVLNLLLLNPIWRFFWRLFPSLARWFPDLNGTWDVQLDSNWPRHQQVLAAATGSASRIDMQSCPETELASLSRVNLKAVIRQSWWSFEMVLTNPRANSPIKKSSMIVLEPFPGRGLEPPAICYFYKQENATDNLADDIEFYGAARLSYDPETDSLEGIAWTARMWRRAMNAAAAVKFVRVK